MDILLSCTLVFTGIWLIGISTLMKTKNIISSIIFKAIPILLGFLCLISALYAFGILKGG